MYRVIQVTDTHVPVTGDMRVRDHFTTLMQYCEREQPDLLVMTGDLPGEDGSREAYEWMRDQLPTSVPFMVLPGNHDDPNALFDVFSDSLNADPGFFETIALDGVDLLFMNTASNSLPDDQLAFLQEGDIRPGSLLFLHHPPREISGGFMDRTYPLLNRDVVDAALAASPVAHVFCGHYHAEHVVRGDYDLYLTPSPAFKVALEATEIEISDPDIPLREIVIDGYDVSTRVVTL